MEEFKTITDYENYKVSNLGNILNVKKNRLMTPVNNNSGYKIKLQGNTFLIHRLVALAFLPNPNNYDVVTHLDNNLKNNNVNNLKWIDKKENLKNIPQEKRKETGLKIQEKLTKAKQNNTIYPRTLTDELLHIIINEITPEEILRFGYVFNDNGTFTTRTFKNKEELTQQKLKRKYNDIQLYQIIKGYYVKTYKHNHPNLEKLPTHLNNCYSE